MTFHDTGVEKTFVICLLTSFGIFVDLVHPVIARAFKSSLLLPEPDPLGEPELLP
jgi:hypothetical protein